MINKFSLFLNFMARIAGIDPNNINKIPEKLFANLAFLNLWLIIL